LADIFVHGRLFCSPYQNLNDPFEGVFIALIPTDFGRGFGLNFGMGGTAELLRTVDDIDGDAIANKRVCSLSKSWTDVRMWSHYADGHRGVAIEIDFNGLEDEVREVQYIDSIEKFASGILAESPDAGALLCRKTFHWDYEQEFRILGSGEYFQIEGRIGKVYVGSRMPANHKNLLRQLLPLGTRLVDTELEKNDITVRETHSRALDQGESVANKGNRR